MGKWLLTFIVPQLGRLDPFWSQGKGHLCAQSHWKLASETRIHEHLSELSTGKHWKDWVLLVIEFIVYEIHIINPKVLTLAFKDIK